MDTPVAPLRMEAAQSLARSLELYERVGDRRGAMSAIIAMAYASWGPDIHFGSVPAMPIFEALVEWAERRFNKLAMAFRSTFA